jgi:hypothetical protein
MVSPVSPFVPSAQSIDFVGKAAEYLKDPRSPVVSVCAAELRATYPILRSEMQKRINQIRERCTAYLTAETQKAHSMDSAALEQLNRSLSINGPFESGWLQEMYENGYPFSQYHVREHDQGRSGEALKLFCEGWFQKICKDFEEGRPHSFPLMANLLWKGELTDRDRWMQPLSFRERAPLNDPQKVLFILKKLAYLEVPEAQKAVSEAYSLGLLHDKVELGLSMNERVRELWKLAELGNVESQRVLAMAYTIPSLGGWRFSVGERLEGMERLQEIEKEELNSFVTLWYVRNQIGDLPCGRSLEKRVEILTQRARRGDRGSFAALWSLYQTNQLGHGGCVEQVPLTLTQAERWEKLNQLVTPQSQIHYDCFYTNWIISAEGGLTCAMTIDQRLAWLEKEVFEHNNKEGIPHLVKCYSLNSWDDCSLKIPLEKRIEKLEMLAARGSAEATKALDELGLRREKSPATPLLEETLKLAAIHRRALGAPFSI